MPLYRGSIYKTLLIENGEKWSNVYTISAANTELALGFLQAIAVLEKAVHYDSVQFDYAQVKQITDGLESAKETIGGTGDREAPAPETVLPLWNTMRVTFGNDQGRPEQKYLRLPLYEADVTGFNFGADTLILVGTEYREPLQDFAAYVGPNGEPHTVSAIYPYVQMRQTNWHRRTRPGFRRGWVPV